MLEAAEALELDDFAVVGTHTGASLALQIALQARPGRVTHAILSGIPLMRPETRAELHSSWAPETPPRPDGSHFEEVWARYAAQGGARPSFTTMLTTSLFSVWERYNWAYNAAFRYDPRPDLPRLACPTLFLTSDTDLLLRADKRALDLVPDSRLTVVEGSEHPLPWFVPDRFAREIVSFTRR